MKSYLDYQIGGIFPVLPYLLVLSLLVIILLTIALYRYKRRLRRSQEYLVRYINYCLELKRLVPTSEQPYSFNPPDITCKEFIKIIDNMLKRMMYLPLFVLLALPLGAQEKADSVYEFRFVPKKDMFFIPYGENYAELQRLATLIDQYREAITDGKIPVYVDGYCNSLPGEAENLNVAKLRSNRMKSELILHEGMKEESFVTHNYAEKGDWVVVRIPVPAPLQTRSVPVAVPEAEQTEGGNTLEPAGNEAVATVETGSDTIRHAGRSEASTPLQAQGEEILRYAPLDCYPAFSLRFNLLRWATLTPDLGIEWRINRNIGILVDGSWTSWSWSDKDRRYALWKVSPEVRYYIGKEKRGFLGAMYHIGEFNYKLGDTGKQGDYQGGGITGGYTLELNRALSLDFHAALGYTYADYDKYKVIDGVRVRAGSDTKNYWGINQLGVTLVWLFN